LFDRIKQQFLSNKNNKAQQHEQTYYLSTLLIYCFIGLTKLRRRKAGSHRIIIIICFENCLYLLVIVWQKTTIVFN